MSARRTPELTAGASRPCARSSSVKRALTQKFVPQYAKMPMTASVVASHSRRRSSGSAKTAASDPVPRRRLAVAVRDAVHAAGSLQAEPHDEREKRGDRAAEERIAPVPADEVLEQDRREESGRRRRLEQAGGHGARGRRKDLRDHRGAGAPLAANAKRRDEAQDEQLARRLGEPGQSGEHGVDQDGQRHRARAAPSIGDHAEDADRRPTSR